MTDERIEMYGKICIALDQIEHCREFTALIPEVRSNLVYAKPDASTRDDVLAIDGRITVVEGMPHAAGKPRFGTSSHMARLIIELMKTDPSVRAEIDFANSPGFSDWLSDYCKKQGWVFVLIDRRAEPAELRIAEGLSMQWKATEAVRAAGGAMYRKLSAMPVEWEKSRSVSKWGMNPSVLHRICVKLPVRIHDKKNKLVIPFTLLFYKTQRVICYFNT
ncbi:MAG: hypothetical protein STSR0009_27610 [Methanoregula sp.]